MQMNGAFHGIEMKRVISQFKLFHIHSMLSQFNLRCIDCNCVTTTTELRWPHRSLPFTVEELLGNTSKQLFLSIGNILKCETFQAELCFSEALVWSRVGYSIICVEMLTKRWHREACCWPSAGAHRWTHGIHPVTVSLIPVSHNCNSKREHLSISNIVLT